MFCSELFLCLSGAQPEIFQDREGFEIGHFDKHFVKNRRKKSPAWLPLLLLDTIKTTFRMKNLT